MNELEFYNQQFEKYKKYDHKRSDDRELSLDDAEDYFEHLAKSYSSIKGTLVDLGCGDGYFTSKLAELNSSVIGIEPSSLINAANELLESGKTRNLSFLQEDAYQLSCESESVELVISRRGPDPEEEIFRVLKRNGIFIYITDMEDNNKMEQSQENIQDPYVQHFLEHKRFEEKLERDSKRMLNKKNLYNRFFFLTLLPRISIYNYNQTD